MSKDSKIALLVGLGFIITYGVILSEARNEKVPGDSGNVALHIDRTAVSRNPRPLTATIPQVHRPNMQNSAELGPVRLQSEQLSRQRQQAVGEVAQPAVRKRMYVVQSGDNLTRIAKKFYGATGGGRYIDIYNANTDQLKSPDSLSVGMKLVIPE